MIEFGGQPFLQYLIEMLREQGFERLLILGGYLHNVIEEYFGKGEKWSIEITYSISPPSFETGARLKAACRALDTHFLLLYCDNYWPMSFDCLWNSYMTAGRQAQVVIYSNRDSYTKDNVLIGPDGRILVYDKTRQTPGLRGIDIGFVLLSRDIIENLPDGANVSFEREAYPRLAACNQLHAFVTDHRYYSVGDFPRLPITELFLARHRTVLLDRDGVLNRRMPKADYVKQWEEWHWLSGALDALRLLHQAGYRCIVVTNQPGIARGALTHKALDDIHSHMCADVEAQGGRIERVYHCPHNWDEGCECRKPRPGMLFQAQKDYHLDLSRVPLVGDDERDAQAAKAAGCPFHLVAEDLPLVKIANTLIRS
jgi:D-glycero-D-manno-heptose 1,7-bisphosphate phosphatase